MLDLSLRLTFRNFATTFLLVALVTVPLHVGIAFATREVVGVSELHPAIEGFPPLRQVRGVGPPDLDAARRAFFIATVIEIALLPIAVGATKRVLAADDRGRLPGVIDGWAHSLGALTTRSRAGSSGVAEVVAGAALGAAAAYGAYRIGLPFVEAVPGEVRFGPAGLLEGVVRAFGAPFLLVPLALFGGRAKDEVSTRPT
jgi:hypothetical protein